jgi:hypothetical protein
MTTAIQVEIQAQAAVESLVNPIDQLAVLTRQSKALEEQIKALKGEIANTYGEGKHTGEKYACTVTLSQRAVVAWKAVAEEAQVPAELIAKHTSSTSIITVATKA